MEILAETQRLFFNTLHNTYSFFVLYANIDNFSYTEADIQTNDQPLLDKWIISLLNTLIKNVQDAYENYDPTTAARLIQNFVNDDLSNWYVRLSRRRFWKSEYNNDKISAFQTLYKSIITIAKLMSPIAPLYSERLFNDLNNVSKIDENISVHLTDFPKYNDNLIFKDLEEEVALAQTISSLVLSLRKKANLQVKQPLKKILIPVLNDTLKEKIENVKNLILTETNVKEIEYISDLSGLFTKKLKVNFKTLGPKYGKAINTIANKLSNISINDIDKLASNQSIIISIDGQSIEITKNDVEIVLEGSQGWQVAEHNNISVAIDTTITDDLYHEGLARQLVNKIQNLRKNKYFEVTDRISVKLQDDNLLSKVINSNKEYITSEILADSLILTEEKDVVSTDRINIDTIDIKVELNRINN
ncbi:MAG: DUF5915 domain-containing protein [Solitalea-like symbiont of Acarus siro]